MCIYKELIEHNSIKSKGTKFEINYSSSYSQFLNLSSTFNLLIAMRTTISYRYERSASRLTVGAHLFGILALILLLVWLLHYRGGLDYDSDNAERVFNVR